MRRISVMMISVGLILALWIAANATCPEIFSKDQVISPAKSAGILSPNQQLLVWSVGVLEKDPEIVRGQVWLQNQRTGRQETIFESQVERGKIVASHSSSSNDNFNQFCIVDWSADSKYLLLQENVGILSSDIWDDYYWVYEIRKRQRRLIDPRPLQQALEKYWQKKGLDLREKRYQTVAVGWAGKKSNRVVFAAFTVYDEEGLFLGIWSVAPTGQAPSLVSEEKEGFKIQGFGKVVNVP